MTLGSQPEAITLHDDRGGLVELFVADPGDRWAVGRPALLVIHGHQFPERPGGRRMLTSALVGPLAAKGWMTAAVSQPGYGGSSGPPDCCGPRTQSALRMALAHLIGRGATPARTLVWGISRGAVAASCAFVDGTPEPGVLILQAGTYDMAGWVAWVRAGARGGDAKLATAILANQRREAGQDREALRARSGIVHARRGHCDVLLVHGARDPQAPAEDRERMIGALKAAGRRVETVIAPGGEHRLPPRLALDGLAKHWPDLVR